MLSILIVLFNLECSPIMCLMFCEHGFKLVDGCEVCECNPDPCEVRWIFGSILGSCKSISNDTGIVEGSWTMTTNSLLILEIILCVSFTIVCQGLVNIYVIYFQNEYKRY